MFERAFVLLCASAAFTSIALAADQPVHDPMRPFDFVAAGATATAVLGAPRYVLTAVVISPTRRIAVINGAPHVQGERVDGAEIVRIEPHSVALKKGREELVIHLGGPRLGEPLGAGDSVP